MNLWCALCVRVVAAALVWSATTVLGTPWTDEGAPPKVRILDVPYVPQSGDLCGGAALAMVLRFWGKPGVMAEDFSALANAEQGGIQTSTLVNAVKACGWIPLPLPGNPADVTEHIARGRPVITLIRAGSNSYHYVVLVAWANGWVILHDPKVGPFRAIREAEFMTSWAPSGDWSLLVLPPRETMAAGATGPAAADLESRPARDGWDALVDAGVLLAQAGDTAAAEIKFLAAQSLCPTSPAPLRERAGLRFRARDWPGARRLAERALALEPGDASTWRLLAGSRFLAGDVEGALRAWNHLSEPRADLTRIDGLTRIRYSAVAGQLGLPPGRLLTPRAFRQAHRRLAEMPAQSDFRLSLKPLPQGIAQVQVTLLERPLVFEGLWGIAGAGVKALTGHEIRIDAASLTGNGELLTAGWRWWKNRPRVSLGLAVPTAGGRPGIWRLEGSWERQTYATRIGSSSSPTTPKDVSREERRRTALSFSDWIGADVRLDVGAALDEWADRGTYLSLEGSVETRWARDHLAFGVETARWMSPTNGAPFGAGDLSLQWSSAGLDEYDGWQGRLGFSGATPGAPLALWSGAGTGYGRAPLLRAHPLLQDGVIRGPAFGRALVHGTIERLSWPWQRGPFRLGWALFVDGAKPWESGQAGRTRWLMDGGTGLRLRCLGIRGQLRIDAARGLMDDGSAVSAAWQIP